MIFDPRLVWLIQRNQDDRLDATAITDTLDSLGVRWINIEIDFRSRLLPPIQGLQDGDRVICHGPSFVTRIDHADPAWKIGSIFNPDSFRWSQFRSNWQELVLNQDGMMSSVGELLASSPDRLVFVRPDADSKVFDGGLRSPNELTLLLKELDPSLAVVTASACTIDAEYRIFIVASEVVAASEYRRAGVPSTEGYVSNEVIDLALDADSRWRPAPAYVMDIARAGERLGIVEANCITAARFYSADKRAVVVALCKLYGEVID